MCLTLMLAAPHADAAACTPFDPSGAVCSTSVPTHLLSAGEPDDTYKGFVFKTADYPFDNAVFDGNWTRTTRNST